MIAFSAFDIFVVRKNGDDGVIPLTVYVIILGYIFFMNPIVFEFKKNDGYRLNISTPASLISPVMFSLLHFIGLLVLMLRSYFEIV